MNRAEDRPMQPRPAAAGTLALEAVGRFLGAATQDEGAAERVESAFRQHLAAIAPAQLPAPARDHWSRAARLLRTSADKPVPESATSAIRSWPSARVAELVGHIRNLHAVLEKVENDRLEDDIRDTIRRHYL